MRLHIFNTAGHKPHVRFMRLKPDKFSSSLSEQILQFTAQIVFHIHGFIQSKNVK